MTLDERLSTFGELSIGYLAVISDIVLIYDAIILQPDLTIGKTSDYG
jgi:hypothetical protein